MTLANEAGEVIEFQALATTDGQCFVVMLPWSENEQLPQCAGFHTGTARLSQVSKAVLLKEKLFSVFVKE